MLLLCQDIIKWTGWFALPRRKQTTVAGDSCLDVTRHCFCTISADVRTAKKGANVAVLPWRCSSPNGPSDSTAEAPPPRSHGYSLGITVLNHEINSSCSASMNLNNSWSPHCSSNPLWWIKPVYNWKAAYKHILVKFQDTTNSNNLTYLRRRNLDIHYNRGQRGFTELSWMINSICIKDHQLQCSCKFKNPLDFTLNFRCKRLSRVWLQYF